MEDKTTMMKKLMTMLLCLVLCFSAVACGGDTGEEGPSENQAVIEFFITDGGIGSEWLRLANERFMAANVNTPYGDKTGVFCRINKGQPSLASMATDGYHVYFMDRTQPVDSMAKTGNLLPVTDWVTEKYDDRDGTLMSIEDKFFPEYKNFTKGDDGEYYGVPYTEVYGGLTYDRKLFNDNGLYFAQTGKGVPYACKKFGTRFEFIRKGEDANKTCGPDGEYGTVDDGLPSTVLEMVTLWYKMNQMGIFPVQLSGKYLNYSDFFLDGMMTSLQGEQEAYATYGLTGEMDVVVGYTDENLFGEISYLKKPIVKRVKITEEQGYYTTWSVAKYYAIALLEIIEREGYFTKGNALSTYSHIDCQQDFIYSGYGTNDKIGMLIEASYWYNESTIRNNFTYFNTLFPEAGGDRDIQWMSLPVNITNPVTGEDKMVDTGLGVQESVKGERPTLIDTSRSAIVFNSRVAKQPEVLAALEDWVKFFNTDEELSYFTVNSNMARPLNYQVKEEHKTGWNQFGTSLWELRKDSFVLRFDGNNETFYSNTSFFARGFQDGAFACHSHNSPMEEFRLGSHWTKVAFEYGMRDKGSWGAMYQGGKTITEDPDVKYVK